MLRRILFWGLLGAAAVAPLPGGAAGGEREALLRELEPHVYPPAERAGLSGMLREQARELRAAVNRRDAAAWARVRGREDWERFRDPRMRALRRSLGAFPARQGPPPVHVGSARDGEGFRVENLLYESRPGLLVTATLYSPRPSRQRMPGILIVHSHHNARTQGELQDMGMTWARAGCLVLVPDLPGYGERRAHAAGSRQDYRHRYISAMQLDLLGESLMGWMTWDLTRGVDLLIARSGIDPERLVLIGSVAGGGDPAAVTAALDPRIACVVPFNFGGPQPETRYPLPEDAETSFNYMGSGSWESTRNLRDSGRDGFLPWTIVAAAAPRRLVYAHEFNWDRQRDPVWKRLGRVFGWYGAGENLAFAHGFGLLSGRPPEASHCNNVGAPHRKHIHAALAHWFAMPVPEEYSARLPAEELVSWTPELRAALRPRPAHALYAELGAARAAAVRSGLVKLSPARRRERLRRDWGRLLGGTAHEQAARLVHPPNARRGEQAAEFTVQRLSLEVERGIVVPLLLLLPRQAPGRRPPVVVCFAQEGKEGFLRERGASLARLLAGGAALCLPDLRGAGETRPPGSRERQSEATSLSSTALMLGRPLLGARLRDLRSVVRFLRARRDLDARRLALWGDSGAPANPPGFRDPLIGEGPQPAQSEPAGGLLALLGALYEDARAVVAGGTLAAHEAVLENPYSYLPHDAVVPGALTAGDVADLAAALAPRPLRLARLVDGRNCPVSLEEARRRLRSTLAAYDGRPERLELLPSDEPSGWLLAALRSEVSR